MIGYILFPYSGNGRRFPNSFLPVVSYTSGINSRANQALAALIVINLRRWVIIDRISIEKSSLWHSLQKIHGNKSENAMKGIAVKHGENIITLKQLSRHIHIAGPWNLFWIFIHWLSANCSSQRVLFLFFHSSFLLFATLFALLSVYSYWLNNTFFDVFFFHFICVWKKYTYYSTDWVSYGRYDCKNWRKKWSHILHNTIYVYVHICLASLRVRNSIFVILYLMQTKNEMRLNKSALETWRKHSIRTFFPFAKQILSRKTWNGYEIEWIFHIWWNVEEQISSTVKSDKTI